MTHKLKIWPTFFKAVKNGSKKFEIRESYGREFNIGDVIVLREWTLVKKYTGREVTVQVTFVMNGKRNFILPAGLSVMSIELVNS